jgi:hypothetical protein
MPSHPEPSLEAGLSAIKQGDFQSAIATLEAVAATGNSNTVLQAQIGLVVVYAKSGNIPKAIALCETLTQSQNLQVQQWANRTLEQLTLPYQSSETSTTDVTRSVPIEPQETTRQGEQGSKGAGEASLTARHEETETRGNFLSSSPCTPSSCEPRKS